MKSVYGTMAQTEQELKESLILEIRKKSPIKADHILIHIQDPHYKFYEMKVEGNILQTRYGRIPNGSSDSSQTFPNKAAAALEMSKKLREKLRKGYEEPTPMSNLIKSKRVPTKKLSAEGLEKLDVFLSSLKQ